MKKFAVSSILIALGVCLGILGLGVSNNKMHAQPATSESSKAAVIMRCQFAPTLGLSESDYRVSAYDRSPNAPSISPAGDVSCATALKILFDDGFAIRQASSAQGGANEILYALVRPIGLAHASN
jgi:hypothetical protein